MASSQYISASTTNGTILESSRKTAPSTPLSSAASTAAAALASSASPISPKTPQNLPPLLPTHISKLSNLTPHTQLTGVAAIAANRQRSPRNMASEEGKGVDGIQTIKQSPNPAALLTAGFAMSTLSDPVTKESSPVPHGLGGLPSVAAAAAAMDTSGSSPTTSGSMVSNGTTVEGSTGTVTAGPSTTDPALLPEITQYHTLQPQPPKLSEPLTSTTPTTPGFSQSATTPTTPFSPLTGGTRGKHTCPHCHKTFTRHHNLKSHLLTHAHEKPFLCTTCQSRFRRLHDLKRHTKLHTGERPHVCVKCGRRFARGDALARHARGEGGCAGRRGSMGGMMNEDGTMVTGLGQDGDDGMEGLEGLMGDEDGDVSMMDGDGSPRRRASLPSIKTDFHQGHQQASHQPGQHTPMTPGYIQRHQNNTYPPLSSGARTGSTSGPSPGNLFPPNYPHGFKATAPASASPSLQANTLSTATTASPAAPSSNPSILSPQGVLTDSPRAVSPGMLPSQPEGTGRERTPSFAGYISSLPPAQRDRDAMFVNHLSQQQQQQHSTPGLQQTNQQHSNGPQGGNGPAPQANMGGNGPHSNANMFTGTEGLWEYIKVLEGRVKGLEDKVTQLEAPQRQQQLQQNTTGS